MLELEPHILALLGVAVAGVGIALVTWGLSALNSAIPTAERSQSLLAPTLAVDTLDDDLRVLYMRTLVLDARCQAARSLDATEECHRLARTARRLLVAWQAARHAARAPATAAESIAEIEATLDDATDAVTSPTGVPSERWNGWISEIEDRISRTIGEVS